MPGHTGIPPVLANGSSVYVYVDEEDQGGDGTAYMVGFYLSPPPPPLPPPPHSSHPLPSQVHNIIVRYSETTPASYVSRPRFITTNPYSNSNHKPVFKQHAGEPARPLIHESHRHARGAVGLLPPRTQPAARTQQVAYPQSFTLCDFVLCFVFPMHVCAPCC
jgi:hypothetical protein